MLSGLIGLAIVTWLVDKAVRFPFIHARQFGAEAPLWVPMIVFVAAATVLTVCVFLRAARRVTAGEDLFARRHRRRPKHTS